MPISGIGGSLPPLAVPGLERAGVADNGAAAGPRTGEGSFSNALVDAVGRVETDQRLADRAAGQLAAGQISDVAQVTITAERAYLSLATLVQVRNKLLEAYQEFMRMQI